MFFQFYVLSALWPSALWPSALWPSAFWPSAYVFQAAFIYQQISKTHSQKLYCKED